VAFAAVTTVRVAMVSSAALFSKPSALRMKPAARKPMSGGSFTSCAAKPAANASAIMLGSIAFASPRCGPANHGAMLAEGSAGTRRCGKPRAAAVENIRAVTHPRKPDAVSIFPGRITHRAK
jgi:hypothetical protein